MAQDLLGAFGIFPSEPSSNDGGPVDFEKIARVLEDVLTANGIKADAVNSRNAQRERVLFRSCVRLAGLGAFEEALFLSNQLRPSQKVAEWQLRALFKTGDTERLSTAMRKYGETFPQTWGTRVAQLDVKLKSPATLQLRDLSVFGPAREDIESQLASIPVERFTTVKDRQLADKLADLRQLPAAQRPDFCRGLVWGRAAMMYLRFTERYLRSRNSTSRVTAAAPHQAEIRLRSHTQQIKERLVISDIALLKEASSKGRNILAAQVHAGINECWRDILAPLKMPTIVFAANGKSQNSNERRQTINTSGGAQMDFLKVAKTVRKSQHLIKIFPDGPAGGDRISGMVLGMPVSIGAGAARLAWFGRAETFCLFSRWREDGRLEMIARKGPVAERDGDQQAFEAAFAEFYFACLNEIARGAPEDMIGKGGVWTQLVRQRATPEGESV